MYDKLSSGTAKNFHINYVCLTDTALFQTTKALADCECIGAL